jgi:hypothetical protein
MALDPLPRIASLPSPTPAREVSDAQRAFFQAALNKLETVAAAPPPSLPAAESPASVAAPADTPKSAYRPGSLLDIRI